MAKGRTPAAQGIPREDITEAMKTFQSARVTVKRRNDKGQLATVYAGVEMPLADLMRIDEYLMQSSGGGNYRVEAFNPSGGHPVHVVAPFIVPIEGPPRPTVATGAPVGASPTGNPFGMPSAAPANPYGGHGHNGAPSYGASVPQLGPIPAGTWAQGLNPQHANAYIAQGNQMGGYPAPPWARNGAQPQQNPNNPVYDRELSWLKGELEKERAKRESAEERRDELRRELDTKAEVVRRELDAKLEAVKEAHRREMKELEKDHERDRREWERERANVRDQLIEAKSQPKSSQMADMLPLLVPALTAYITSTTDRDKDAAARQLEMVKLQIEAARPKDDGKNPTVELLAAVGPLLLPIIQQQMENKGPSAMAALLESVQHSQMTSLGMTMQVIEAMMPEERPMWAEVLMEALGQLRGVGEAMVKGIGPGEDRSMRQAIPASTPARVVEHVESGTHVREPEPVEEELTLDEQVARVTAELDERLIPLLPESFQTPEWRAILIGLHTGVDATELGRTVAEHLDNLATNGTLPEQIPLEELLGNPEAVLSALLDPLPMHAQHPAYVEQVKEATLQALIARGTVQVGEPNVVEHEAAPEEPAEEMDVAPVSA